MHKYLKNFSISKLANFTIEKIHNDIIHTSSKQEAEQKLGITADSIHPTLYNKLKKMSKKAAESYYGNKYQSILSFVKLPFHENKDFSQRIEIGTKVYRAHNFHLDEQGIEEKILTEMNEKAVSLGLGKSIFFLYPHYNTDTYSIFIEENNYLSWETELIRSKFIEEIGPISHLQNNAYGSQAEDIRKASQSLCLLKSSFFNNVDSQENPLNTNASEDEQGYNSTVK